MNLVSDNFLKEMKLLHDEIKIYGISLNWKNYATEI